MDPYHLNFEGISPFDLALARANIEIITIFSEHSKNYVHDMFVMNLHDALANQGDVANQKRIEKLARFLKCNEKSREINSEEPLITDECIEEHLHDLCALAFTSNHHGLIQSLIWWFYRKKHFDGLTQFCNNSIDLADYRNGGGLTILHDAIKTRHFDDHELHELVMFVMNEEQRNNILFAQDPYGCFPVEYDKSCKHYPTIWDIFSQALYREEERTGRSQRYSAFEYAVLKSRPKVVKQLVEKFGADPFARMSSPGATAFSLALESDFYKEMIGALSNTTKEFWAMAREFLLHKHNGKNYFQKLVGHKGVSYAAKIFVRLEKLIPEDENQRKEFLAAIVCQKTHRGKTLLHDVVTAHYENGDVPLVQEFIKKIIEYGNPDKDTDVTTIRDKNGCLPAWYARQSKNKMASLRIFYNHKLEKQTNDGAFSNLVGFDDIKREIKRTIRDFFNADDLGEEGAHGGILFSGPPGCGKTELARAAARSFSCHFECLKATDFQDIYVNSDTKNLEAIFQRLENMREHVIVFIDEIDAIVPSRGDSSNFSNKVVNWFLTKTSELRNKNIKIFIILATNRPDVIDSALVRSERISKHIIIKKPTREERYTLLVRELRKKEAMKCPDHLIQKLADILPNVSMADLKKLVQEATSVAREERGDYEGDGNKNTDNQPSNRQSYEQFLEVIKRHDDAEDVVGLCSKVLNEIGGFLERRDCSEDDKQKLDLIKGTLEDLPEDTRQKESKSLLSYIVGGIKKAPKLLGKGIGGAGKILEELNKYVPDPVQDSANTILSRTDVWLRNILGIEEDKLEKYLAKKCDPIMTEYHLQEALNRFKEELQDRINAGDQIIIAQIDLVPHQDKTMQSLINADDFPLVEIQRQKIELTMILYQEIPEWITPKHLLFKNIDNEETQLIAHALCKEYGYNFFSPSSREQRALEHFDKKHDFFDRACNELGPCILFIHDFERRIVREDFACIFRDRLQQLQKNLRHENRVVVVAGVSNLQNLKNILKGLYEELMRYFYIIDIHLPEYNERMNIIRRFIERKTSLPANHNDSIDIETYTDETKGCSRSQIREYMENKCEEMYLQAQHK